MMFSKTFLCVIELTFVRRLYILILTAAKEINQGTGHYFFLERGGAISFPGPFLWFSGAVGGSWTCMFFSPLRFAHESFLEVKLRN